jgi:LPPG:FO 2-phospho-L-lactate transferase
MKIAALAGGVGGARLADGLAQNLAPADLTIIVNTGDDFDHLGLRICPDLDTVCYTLAGMANAETGWGRADETWNALAEIQNLRGPAWFRIGDRDLGAHLERTRRLRGGASLNEVVRDFCAAWSVEQTILAMTDSDVRTIVKTADGDMTFQEYFVKRACEPTVKGFEFRGAAEARAAPGVLEALTQADAVIVCPSNPWVSIAPILSVPAVSQTISARKTLAVSPIVRGHAVKGPAAKMYAELGFVPSAVAVATHYRHIARFFALDSLDAEHAPAINALGLQTLVTDTIMRTRGDRRAFAAVVLDFLQRALQ